MQRLVEQHRRLVVGGALALWGAGLVTFFALIVAYDLDFFGPLGGPWVLSFGAFAVVGALITWHRPGHVIGLLFLAHGLAAPVANSVMALAMGPFAEHSLGLRTLFIAISVAWTTTMFPLLSLAIVLFPDGRLPSPRWRWLPWAVVATMLLGATAAFTGGGWGGDPEQVLLAPPFDGRLAGVAEVLSPPFFLLTLLLVGVMVCATVVRYRRAEPLARQQLKWLALAVLLLALPSLAIAIVQGAMRAPAGLPTMVMATAVTFVPVSVGIAILRHRLYDVDLVLNRTIVFTLLAVFITGLYAATVVGVGSLIGDRSNLVLSIGTVALIAVVFEPVRDRVQRWANVVVYGQRATPYALLSAVADELESTAAAESQLITLAGLLADGTGAVHATVWVEEQGGLRAVGCWPVHDPAEHPVVADASSSAVPDTVHTELVRADGDLLGALSFARGREDPVTPRERQLMAEMAGQAALVLSNARLRERLRARVEELRSSRQRLVAAQDEARRKLERDLHDGAQQQLVALKVKLGLARRMADKETADATLDELLLGLSDAADEAVDALRSLARGIYPPLLEAEGLERAVTTQVGKAPIPVVVSAQGLRRYGREVEATVYFCVLEALSNALKHADATAFEVVLEERDGQVRFQVADDGKGFDPRAVVHGLGLVNMADRIEALGGSLTLEARAGGGVRVLGAVPASMPVTMPGTVHPPDVEQPVASPAG